MNAIELLESQHREAEELFSQIEAAPDQARKQLFVTLAQKLTGHMEIEEQIFYPAVYEVDSTEVKHAYEEHGEAKPIMDQLLHLDGSEDNFLSLLSELKEKITHHVKEEESELFPEVRQELSPDELDDLGEEMDELLARIEADPSILSRTPGRRSEKSPEITSQF